MYTMYVAPKKVTATQARQNFFKLLDQAKADGQEIEIEKDGVVVAKIVPTQPEKIDWQAYFDELAAMPRWTEEEAKSVEQARKDSYKKRFPAW